MSKKTSKILIVAVVAILAISMIGLVACGPKGPAPLEGATAMDTLEKGFETAKTKSVTENISVSGATINLANLIEVKLKGVDVAMTRKYENGVLNIDAVIKNLDVAVTKGLSMITGFMPDNMKLDATVIKNLSKVSIEANVDIDPDMVVTVNKFIIKGLDQVVDAGGNQFGALKDGDGNPLGAIYEPGEIKGTTVDPRHESTGEGDADGLFTAMDKWSTNEAGAIMEDFLKKNYQMASLYKFGAITVADTAISSDAATDFSEVYAMAQDVLEGYIDRELVEGNADATLNNILTKVFGTTNVADAVGTIVDMGNAKMNGTIKADGDAWKLVTLNTTQAINVNISGATLGKVVSNVLPIFGVDLNELGIPSGLIDGVLKGGVSTPINVSTSATFAY